jgi:hypothetical protein
MAKTLSGASWVEKFPTSTSTADLTLTFRTKVEKFIAAMEAAGASVKVEATLRPKQRAYLMHWAFRVARQGYDANKVPAMKDVEIDWVHVDSNKKINVAASKANAEQMVQGYEIAYPPVLKSRHTEGNAIDMSISWTSAELKIRDGNGKDVTIKHGVKSGGNHELHKVGKSYHVFKLIGDPPHWSSDGH